MQKFPETTKDIGEVVEGSIIDIVFPYTDNGQIISALTPDCGACTTLFNQGDKIIARYVVEEIPPQVFESGQTKQEINKGFTVGLAGGSAPESSERLYFTGYILPKNG